MRVLTISSLPLVACALTGVLAMTALSVLSGCASAGTSAQATLAPPSRGETTDRERLAQVRYELAAAYFGRGQSETALNEINEALAAKPDFAQAHGLRGLIRGALGQVDQADEDFRTALKFLPHDDSLMHNYAWFMCQQKRYAQADAQFAAALAEPSNRDQVRSWLARGVCQARNQRLDDADQSLSRAYELDPGSPAVATNLAEVLYRKGEYERARFYIRRVNSNDAQISAASLWLALRIERKLGQQEQVRILGEQIQQRFGGTAEARAFEQGRFDD